MKLDSNTVIEYIYLDGAKTGIRVFNENDNPNTFLVPIHNDNTDYQAIQVWDAIDGNTITDNGS